MKELITSTGLIMHLHFSQKDRRLASAANLRSVFAIGSALILVLALATTNAGASELDRSNNRSEIESIIRDYLTAHPEIVVRAFESYKAQQDQARESRVQAMISARRREIEYDPGSPVGGNKDGDVALVEFFDYQCPICKQAHSSVEAVVNRDGNVRRIYKEWPILGPVSVFAARAALASRKQNKYIVFHDALMTARVKLDQSMILAIARSVGIDDDRLKRDMNDEELDSILRRNQSLAASLFISGTPTFVIGGKVLSGARDSDSLRENIVEARKRANAEHK